MIKTTQFQAACAMPQNDTAETVAVAGQDVTVITAKPKQEDEAVLTIGYLTPDEATKAAAQSLARQLHDQLQPLSSQYIASLEDGLGLARQDYTNDDGRHEAAFQYAAKSILLRRHYDNGRPVNWHGLHRYAQGRDYFTDEPDNEFYHGTAIVNDAAGQPKETTLDKPALNHLYETLRFSRNGADAVRHASAQQDARSVPPAAPGDSLCL